MADVAAARAHLEETAKFAMEALAECFRDAKDKPRPHRGTIKCPKCGGTLHYLAKTSAPGTIWGQCATDDCLRWMV